MIPLEIGNSDPEAFQKELGVSQPCTRSVRFTTALKHGSPSTNVFIACILFSLVFPSSRVVLLTPRLVLQVISGG